MNAAMEKLSETSLEKAFREKPVSVYNVNFTPVINNFTEKRFLPKRKAVSREIVVRKPFSKKIFKWQNAGAVAAILAIGVLHFTFQMSFIRREVSKNRSLVEVPAVKIEPARVAPLETVPDEFEVNKIDAPMPKKSVLTFKLRQSEIAPAKTQPKKKEVLESRAGRLRRAEKILTGV
jgi:hypothetical protein